MAANPLKGEVELKVSGKTYTLTFTSNAIVQVEQLLGGISIADIGQQMGRMEYLRALLWAGLQKHHEGLDLFAVSDLMDDCEGGMSGVMEPVTRALRFRLSGVAVTAPLTDEQ